MDSIENSANFELCFIYFYEQYAWFTEVGKCGNSIMSILEPNNGLRVEF